ncbi:MAG: hypothetical protein NC321_16495 [Clostridium sp.]|nr:hypothetical protein [Clostridium sp.]
MELTGTIISCDDGGNASIEYEGGIYEDVKILDEALLIWLRDKGRTLDTVGICFATDENGVVYGEKADAPVHILYGCKMRR